jgi:hypothetical protein
VEAAALIRLSRLQFKISYCQLIPTHFIISRPGYLFCVLLSEFMILQMILFNLSYGKIFKPFTEERHEVRKLSHSKVGKDPGVETSFLPDRYFCLRISFM